MQPFHIDEALLEEIRVTPKGHVFEVPVIANLVSPTDLDSTEKTLIAKFEEAGGPPLITDGRPTVIRVVAWMAHASEDAAKPYINGNRLAFVKEELHTAAAKIGGINPLVMDWNHSAVRNFGDEQKVIGVWHRAEVAFNPAAKAWGIIAQGVMFAWTHPKIANSMLADQQRLGHVRFSMACISQSVEYKTNDDGPFAVAHNPVFFTLSALDVEPADDKAIGRGVEGSQEPDVEKNLADELKAASQESSLRDIKAEVRRVLAEGLERETLLPELLAASKQEITMTPEEIAALQDEKTAADAKIAELTARVAELEGAETARAEAEAAAEAAAEEEATPEVPAPEADAETRIAELETVRGALSAELEVAKTEVARLTEELAAANEKVAEFVAKEEAAARATLIASRLAALPEAFQAAFEKKDDAIKAKLTKKWESMSNEDWDVYVAEELGGFSSVKVGYRERSEAEGLLLTASESGESIKARIAKHKK